MPNKYPDPIHELTQRVTIRGGTYQPNPFTALALASYLVDSSDGGWDGWEKEERNVIRKVCQDILAYMDNSPAGIPAGDFAVVKPERPLEEQYVAGYALREVWEYMSGGGDSSPRPWGDWATELCIQFMFVKGVNLERLTQALKDRHEQEGM